MIEYDLKREANTTAHHTSDYDFQESSSVVLRRGADFTFEILLSHPFDVTSDFLEIEFARGNNAQLNDGSKFYQMTFSTSGGSTAPQEGIVILFNAWNKGMVLVSLAVPAPMRARKIIASA